MKWSEFKDYVDSQIEAIGECEDPIVEYIDTSAPDLSHPMKTPDVLIDDDGAMAIFS